MLEENVLEREFYNALDQANIADLPTLEEKNSALNKLVENFKNSHENEINASRHKITAPGSQLADSEPLGYSSIYQSMLEGSPIEWSGF